MCGIAGVMGKLSAGQVEASVHAMTAAQAHRGPDDEGIAVFHAAGAVVGLGNRRLAIQDLSPLGHQPMYNPATGDVLAYNGEIYNAPELRGELEQKGIRFRGHSDTEVLLRGYEVWGVDCLERLRGMFAFALWNEGRSRLLIARDHVGMKPLYYAAAEGQWFVCASEIKALMASGLLQPDIDRRALAGYLAFGAVQEPLTIYKGVFALKRGCWREFDAQSHVTGADTFWKVPPVTVCPKTVASQIDEGRSLLEKAVQRHLLSDVPVGIFLSSGLDSTAILGNAQKVTSEHLHAFSVSFPDHWREDEAPIARQTAARFGVQYHEYPVDDSTALLWICEGLDRMDQPSMDGFNTHIVARAVREQGIAVALSGMGGDELFGGYPAFRRVPRLLQLLSTFNAVPPSWRGGVARIASALANEIVKEKSVSIARLDPDLLAVYFQSRRLISDEVLGRLGLDWRSLGLEETFQIPGIEFGECLLNDDPVASVSRLETIFYLGNMLLRDSDVFGMANSLEIRVPFLDRDLLEWAFRLAGGMLLPQGAAPKYLLRQMCAPFFSESQLTQPKRGFALPFATWLMGPLRDLMHTNLEMLKNSGLVRPEGVDHVATTFLREPHSPAWSRIWALVTLGHWLNTQHKRPQALASSRAAVVAEAHKVAASDGLRKTRRLL
jgi:asparagine synthase (glutamine-hydrolysing)